MPSEGKNAAFLVGFITSASIAWPDITSKMGLWRSLVLIAFLSLTVGPLSPSGPFSSAWQWMKTFLPWGAGNTASPASQSQDNIGNEFSKERYKDW